VSLNNAETPTWALGSAKNDAKKPSSTQMKQTKAEIVLLRAIFPQPARLAQIIQGLCGAVHGIVVQAGWKRREFIDVPV
jgi:hypothetical protein